MRVSEVSKRYAKALLAATKQKGVHQKAFADLQVIAKAFAEDASIKAYFENPVVTSDNKIAVVKAALTGKPILEEVISTLVLLAQNNRIESLAGIVLAFQDLLDKEEGLTRGTVRSAQPLPAEAQKDLEAKITKVLNKKIVLKYEFDPKLLGGVVAQAEGWTFDDSIETHLRKLNEELNRRAN